MIQDKLLLIQKEWAAVTKDWKNPFTKSNYITLDNIVDTLSPIRSKHEVVVYHHTEDNHVVTTAYDVESKTSIESKFKLIDSQDPQKLWSCITYAKRYNLGQLFNITTDRDDDGNAAAARTTPAVTQIK